MAHRRRDWRDTLPIIAHFGKPRLRGAAEPLSGGAGVGQQITEANGISTFSSADFIDSFLQGLSHLDLRIEYFFCSKWREFAFL